MSIEVRIPTILRSYTDGAKTVEGQGSTLDELIADLESRHAGLREYPGQGHLGVIDTPCLSDCSHLLDNREIVNVHDAVPMDSIS